MTGMSSPRPPRNKLRKSPPVSFRRPQLQVDVTRHSQSNGQHTPGPSSPVTVSGCSQTPLPVNTNPVRRASTTPSRKLTKPRPSSRSTSTPVHKPPDRTACPSISPPPPPPPPPPPLLPLPLPPPLTPPPNRARARTVSESGHVRGHVHWSPVRVFAPLNLIPRTRHTSFTSSGFNCRHNALSPFADNARLRSMHSLESTTQSQLPADATSEATGVRKRRALAMAMTDERITDEVFVHELESMRTDLQGTDGDSDDISDGDVCVGSREATASNLCMPIVSSQPGLTWQTARCALFTCRELVRTERTYHLALQALLAADTSTPPPPLMLTYLSDLSAASAVLLGRMEEDPSAWGVASAFITGEDDLERAYVRWCGVVGGFFVDRAEDEKTRRSHGMLPKRTPSGTMGESSTGSLLRTVNTWRKSMQSIASVNASASHLPVYHARKNGGGNGSEKERAKPNVRDLAILPTQRVTRYVLLYRDLLVHTPATSPSRVLVERAVDTAVRIAQKSDRAQNNGKFFLGQ